jgi:LPXTG-motif cell wall-anchored protein
VRHHARTRTQHVITILGAAITGAALSIVVATGAYADPTTPPQTPPTTAPADPPTNQPPPPTNPGQPTGGPTDPGQPTDPPTQPTDPAPVEPGPTEPAPTTPPAAPTTQPAGGHGGGSGTGGNGTGHNRNVNAAPDSGPSLPMTGTDAAGITGAGLALLVGGTLLVRAAGRRRRFVA